MGKNKVYEPSDDDFKEIISLAKSYSDCLRRLGLGTKGGTSSKLLKKRIEELNCSTDHFLTRGKASADTRKIPLEQILVEKSSYQNISRLKIRLVNEGKLDYVCSICGIKEWLGKPLSLQLDHINGVSNDHRIENLRFVCPNCHTQTDTYAGRNIGA